MFPYDIITASFWLIFIVYWGISAFNTKRSSKKMWRWFGFRLLLIGIVIVVFHSELWNSLYSYHVDTIGPAYGGIGLVLCGIGIGYAIYARVYLGRNWGMPMSIKESPELVTDGPYAYVRHPIYSGVSLAMLGSAFASSFVWLAAFAIFGAYFFYSATREEQTMLKAFPETYPAYKQRTKMFIPFVL
jgi:protein-S-isoprenylcysteine O-methyltransferase Ste14